MILQLLALFSSATFFGAALYISLVQHPAALEAGGSVGGRFFPPMYKRAARMQIVLALAGSVSGFALWLYGIGFLWLIGAFFLFSVFPVTLILIKPVNDKLLSSENDPDSVETKALLRCWGPLHWIRTVASGTAFVIYLIAGIL